MSALPPPSLAHLQGSVAPRDTWGEVRALIDHAVTNRPRDLQTMIGPSGLGNTCDRCLIHALAGHREVRENGSAWLPYVGTCVHAGLQEIMVAANGERVRWLTETRVNVGEVGGVPIEGNADLFDLETGTVEDWKIVGKTTLDKAHRAGFPGVPYQVQAHLYGRGFARRGLTVTTVRITMLPRNATSLDTAYRWSEPYDEGIALAALARADRFARFIALVGVEQVLADAPPHNGQEYSCSRFPNVDGTYLPMPGHYRAQEAFSDILPPDAVS